MASVKRQVVEAIAALLGGYSQIAGLVIAGPVAIDDGAEWPAVIVLPIGKDKLQPTQDGLPLASAGSTHACVSNGEWRGLWQVRVAATDPAHREEVEDAVWEALGDHAEVAIRPVLGDLRVTEDLSCFLTIESAAWNEGQAQDGRHYSFIELAVQYPRLRIVKDDPIGEIILQES